MPNTHNSPLSMVNTLRHYGMHFDPVEIEVPAGVYPDFSGKIDVTWVRQVVSQVATVPHRSFLFHTNYDLLHIGSSIEAAHSEFRNFLSEHDLEKEGIERVVQLAWMVDTPTLGRVPMPSDIDFYKSYSLPSYFGGICGGTPTSHSMTALRSTHPDEGDLDGTAAVSRFMEIATQRPRAYGKSTKRGDALY